jgi:serine/threonine protein phosphatase PrpC
VSTSRSPELASSTAVDSALEVLLGPRADGPTRTRDAIAVAGRAVGRLDEHPSGPSCTLVSALVEPVAAQDGGGVEITVGWVGDSRAYWLAEPGAAEPAAPLTSDHSWAVEMVAAGLIDPAVAADDRRAHAITRWLGPDTTPKPEVVTLRPAGSGALLLCTDGLWNDLPDPADLAAVALPEARTSPLAAAAALTAVALQAGGRDNITVVIIPVNLRSRP